MASALLAGFRLGWHRVLSARMFFAALAAIAVGLLGGFAEQHSDSYGATTRALEGTAFGLVIPLMALAVLSAALDQGHLASALTPLARWGASRRPLAIGVSLAAMLAAATASAVVAVATAAAAHDPAGVPLSVDAPKTAWIAALTSCAYVAFFAFGSTWGKRGGGRVALLVVDLLMGSAAGIGSLLVPRAHARNLLGGEPPHALLQSTSALMLLAMTIVLTMAAAARCPP